MRTFTLTIATALWSLVSADEEEPSDVHTLTESNFDEFISQNHFVLTEFYAPWCGHCKALKPEYAKAATELKTAGSPVKLAMIDATEEKDLASKFDVRGYPSLIWFEKGQKVEFDGGRTAADIVEWVTEASQPAVKELAASAAVPAPSKRPVVVFTAPGPSAAFVAVAEAHRRKADFFVKSGSAVTLTIQHAGEELITKEFPTVESATEAALKDAFEENAFPLFGELNGQSYSRYMDRGQGVVWLLSEVKGDFAKAVEELRPTGLALAKKLPEYSIVYIDTVQFKGAVENMLGVTSFPAAALHLEAGSKKKFIFDLASVNGVIVGKANEIASWVHKAENGEVLPSWKSEEIPEKNEGPVKTIVGKNLEKMVFDAEKDVLLAITATWCGHCKKLKPEYEKVAKKVVKEGLENVLTIATLDGTLNDSPVEDISWQGFPTIFYVKAGTREVISYDGGRDAKGIWKWLKSNHSKKELFAKKPKADEDTKSDSKDEL